MSLVCLNVYSIGILHAYRVQVHILESFASLTDSVYSPNRRLREATKPEG